MSKAYHFEAMTLEGLAGLAGLLAPILRSGDVIALRGELGAGKTAFARLLIGTLLERDEDIPSPSFALLQSYDTPRMRVHHFDFYRLSGPSEALELGFEEALDDGLVIIEWPERLGEALPDDRLDIALEQRGDPNTRHVTVTGLGCWSPRLDRFRHLNAFLCRAGWESASPSYVNGDASMRAYTRFRANGHSAMLMDWPRAPDGPPIRHNRPYSAIAHLAEDVRPFVAIARALRRTGLGAPEIYAEDLERGFVLLEDFGDDLFTRAAVNGRDPVVLYGIAVEALLRLRQARLPAALEVGDGGIHALPPYDREALAIETELLLDWLLPALTGTEVNHSRREAFVALWDRQFDWLLGERQGWVLRDFHSPNLIWRAAEEGLSRLGILDFQDAVIGHPAYDLVSLLQDARLDLPPGLEARLFDAYCSVAAAVETDFDRARFARAYALLGAQRNTKILGIFARLARRDGKRAYLRHMPRVARYLARDLDHPELAELRQWYAEELPPDLADQPPAL